MTAAWLMSPLTSQSKKSRSPVLSCAFQVLRRDYQLTLCAAEPGPVQTTSGFPLVAARGLGALAEADTVFVPGFAPQAWPPQNEILDALRAAHARGARIASI